MGQKGSNKITCSRKTKKDESRNTPKDPIENTDGDEHGATQCPALFDYTDHYSANNTYD